MAILKVKDQPFEELKRQGANAPLLVSAVQSAIDTQTRDISADKVIEAIRTGGRRLKGSITRIRNRFEAELAFSQGDEKKAKRAVEELKKALPGVTWSGTFSQRANDKLISYSGLFCADLDLLGER